MALLVRPDPQALGHARSLGVLALVVAGLCWASGSLYSRYQTLHPHRGVSGTQQMIAGGAAMLLVSVLRGELGGLDLSAVSSRSLVAFAYLTVFGSMVAFSAFNWLVGVTTPSTLSTTAYVNPVVAIVLAWLVLGETLHPMALVGATLIVCAVIVRPPPSPR
jgi:drug/metabolite transporter (DMT)-like permease